MAHESQVTGEISELTAAIALLSNGYEVARPIVAEKYDLIIRDPLTNEKFTVQVKTIRRREDRGNELVVKATNGKGEPYTPDSCDLIVGVENESIYMFECTGKTEYWASDATAAKRWVKFTRDERIDPVKVADAIKTPNYEKAAI
jgi:hypothetical protein